MATTLTQLLTSITTNLTPQAGGDTVSAAEMRTVMNLFKTVISERGVILLAATSDLANTPSTESQFAVIDGVGLFIYKSAGAPDNINSFPAQNGGIWLLALPDASISSVLTAISGLSPASNDILQFKNGSWANRTPTQLRTDIAVDQVPNVDTRNPSNITQDATHRFATDLEKTTWNAKQNSLVSGQNIKTINNQSLLGAGDIQITSQGNIITDATPQEGSSNAVQSGGTATALNLKKDKIVKTKTAHGFLPAWAIYWNGTIWARGNSATNGDARKTITVKEVIDANTFVLGQPGDIITGMSGLTVNAPYYLAPTTTNTANYQTAEPSVVGQWSKILFVAISATEARIEDEFGYEVADPSAASVADGSVTNAKLATDVKVGSLASLNTSTKADAVSAINEVKAQVDGVGSVALAPSKDYISLPPLSTPGSASATAASSSQINIAWADISGEVNYIVQRSTSLVSGYSTVSTPAAGSTGYNDTGLAASTQYFYRFKAIGDGWTTRDSQWVFVTATTSAAGGGAPTVEQEIFLNFTNQYRDPNAYASVQGIQDTGGTAVAAGTAGMNNVKDINAVTTTVDFLLTSAGLGTQNNADGGADPSNTTVFAKQQVAAESWRLSNNGTFKLSGLVASRTYKLYFWCYTNSWEGSVVNFTCNGVTTSNVDSSANTGDAAGNPLLDAALREIDVVSDVSGEILCTAHNVSGVNQVPLTALYIQRMSS